MTAAAIFENNNSYVINGLTDRREIWHGDAYWQLKSRPFKNPGWCTGENLPESDSGSFRIPGHVTTKHLSDTPC